MEAEQRDSRHRPCGYRRGPVHARGDRAGEEHHELAECREDRVDRHEAEHRVHAVVGDGRGDAVGEAREYHARGVYSALDLEGCTSYYAKHGSSAGTAHLANATRHAPVLRPCTA